MLRRTLPVLAAAAALALTPGVALAAPAEAPVEHGIFDSSYAGIQVTVDGRPGSASLTRLGTPGDWHTTLLVSLPGQPDCEFPWWCQPVTRSASVELTDDQFFFGADLQKATTVEVPVTLTTSSFGWWPAEDAGPGEDVRVTLTITGTGPVTRDAYHGDYCGEGWPCHGTRVDEFREATGVLTVDGLELEGVGAFVRGHSVDAAGKPSDGGDGGEPSNGSGD